MLLGDAITERENGVLRISLYLDFKEKYQTDDQMKSSLRATREFVEQLPLASDDLESLVR